MRADKVTIFAHGMNSQDLGRCVGKNAMTILHNWKLYGSD